MKTFKQYLTEGDTRRDFLKKLFGGAASIASGGMDAILATPAIAAAAPIAKAAASKIILQFVDYLSIGGINNLIGDIWHEEGTCGVDNVIRSVISRTITNNPIATKDDVIESLKNEFEDVGDKMFGISFDNSAYTKMLNGINFKAIPHLTNDELNNIAVYNKYPEVDKLFNNIMSYISSLPVVIEKDGEIIPNVSAKNVYVADEGAGSYKDELTQKLLKSPEYKEWIKIPANKTTLRRSMRANRIKLRDLEAETVRQLRLDTQPPIPPIDTSRSYQNNENPSLPQSKTTLQLKSGTDKVTIKLSKKHAQKLYSNLK